MPDCEENVLDIPPRLAVPDPTDVVIITDITGASFITPWSVLNAAILPKSAIYITTGSEAGICTFPTMASVDYSRVWSIERVGTGVRYILDTLPTDQRDVQYESDGSGATVTTLWEFLPDEWVKVLYV